VPTATNAVQYAKLVREKGLLRWLTYVATRMLKDSHEVSGDPLAVATSAAVEIEKIVNHAKRLGGSQA
jgi:replicative DNA helicase